jgi:hypothetical protein
VPTPVALGMIIVLLVLVFLVVLIVKESEEVMEEIQGGIVLTMLNVIT